MSRLSSPRNLAIALIVLMFALPFALAGAYLVSKHQWAEVTLTELEPRYARLLGLEASQTDLNQALTESAARLSQYVYPASQDVSQAGNDAQQRIRDIATRAGLSIVSSQVLPPKAERQFDRIPLTLRLEGELPALLSALTVIGGQSPTINFEGFSVQTIGAVKAEVPQRLGVQFNLFVLRAKDAVSPAVASTAPTTATTGFVASASRTVVSPSVPAAAPVPAAALGVNPNPAPAAIPAPTTASPPPPSPPPAQQGGASFGGGATFGAPPSGRAP